MPTIAIREATAGDSATILRFVRELAAYERQLDQLEATEDALRESLFGPGSPCRVLVCSVDGEDAGFALFFYNYSTWQARRGLYLEDLYVTPRHRRVGAGKALLRRLARIAVAEGCGRFEWSVLDWNQPSIDFFRAAGGVTLPEWVRVRMDGQALQRFAAGQD